MWAPDGWATRVRRSGGEAGARPNSGEGPVARGTVGIRLPVTRFVCKIKMSQDKSPVTQRQVMAALQAPEPSKNPGLADNMARTFSSD